MPPSSSELALAQIAQAYGRPASEVLAEFDATPVASASIAQVHFARLRPEDFSGSRLLQVPEGYWEQCTTTVMVMERMRGIPISQIEALSAADKNYLA